MRSTYVLSFWEKTINDPLALMFDKKVKVYSDIMFFLSNVVQTNKVTLEDHFNFYSCVTFSRLLFDEKICDYVLTVHNKAVDYAGLIIKFEDMKNSETSVSKVNPDALFERKKELVIDEINDLKKWFKKQLKAAPCILEQDIKIK